MTLDIIQKHKDKPWDWGHVSYNPNLTINLLKTIQ